jgi:hypothetical protein
LLPFPPQNFFVLIPLNSESPLISSGCTDCLLPFSYPKFPRNIAGIIAFSFFFNFFSTLKKPAENRPASLRKIGQTLLTTRPTKSLRRVRCNEPGHRAGSTAPTCGATAGSLAPLLLLLVTLACLAFLLSDSAFGLAVGFQMRKRGLCVIVRSRDIVSSHLSRPPTRPLAALSKPAQDDRFALGPRHMGRSPPAPQPPRSRGSRAPHPLAAASISPHHPRERAVVCWSLVV